MKKIILSILLLIISMSIYAQQNTNALGLVYSLGVLSSKMTNGIVVGNGEYVITTKSAVFEKFSETNIGKVTKEYGSINKFPIFVNLGTGDAYECTTVGVFEDADLALLKLPTKLSDTNHIATNVEIGRFPNGIFENNPIGSKVKTTYIGLQRNDETGEFKLITFNSNNGLLEKNAIANKIYMCDIDKNVLPAGGMLIKDKNFIGVLSYIIPLITVSSKETDTNVGAEFDIANYTINYTNKNNVTFSNTPTTKTEKESEFNSLKEFNKIFSALEFGTQTDIIDAVSKYSKKDTSSLANAILGLAYEKQKDIDNATKCYKKAIELDPNQVFPVIRLAVIKESKEAISNLLLLANKYPNDFRVYENLSNLYTAQGETKLASDYINKAIKCSPNDPVLLLKRAKIAKERGRDQEVMDTFAEINKLIPTWDEGLRYQIEYYIERNSPDIAYEVCNYWFESNINNPMAYVYFAKISYLKNDKEATHAYLDQARLKTDNKDMLAYIDQVEKELK